MIINKKKIKENEGVLGFMLVRCRECKKEFELPKVYKVSDYQCDCGGNLQKISPTMVNYSVKKMKTDTNLVKLIKCPLCEHDLSNKASTCPHCGNPLNKKVEDQTWMLLALFLPFVGMLAGTLFGVKEREGWKGIILASILGLGLYVFIFYTSVGAILSAYT
jgi:rRNA maturation endonuclease Nob1